VLSVTAPAASSTPSETGTTGFGETGVFRFELTNKSSEDTTFTYLIDSGSTATSGSDYTALSGTATIDAGDTFVEVTVDVLNDAVIEPNETVTVDLTGSTVTVNPNSSNVTVTPQTATVTIQSDDFGYIVVRQADVTNGSEDGPTPGQFVISLNSLPDGTGVPLTSTTAITVQIQTGGTATVANGDRGTIAGTATIAIGSPTEDVSFTVIDDALAEGTETVTLTATGLVVTPPGFALGTALSATSNVFDNDSAPTIAAQAFTIPENSPAGAVPGLGPVVAADADLPGDTLTFSVTGGTGASVFAVDPATGAVTVTNPAALDFETTTSFTLDITVTDSGGNTGTGTVTINLTDVVEGAITVGGLIVNSVADAGASITGWTPIFRDFVDGGFNDGPSMGVSADGIAEGYRITGGESLPWVNLNQIKVQFSANVGASLDANDFVLSGMNGFDSNFAAGVVPMIVGPVAFDTSTNIATLQLDQGMGPNQFTLTVLAADIDDGSGGSLAGGDQSFQFLVLPGDSVDVRATNPGGNVLIVNNNDAGFVVSKQSGFLFDGPGNNATDTGYFDYDIRADLDGNGQVQGPDGTIVRNRQASFVFLPAPSPAMSAVLADDSSTSSETAADEVFSPMGTVESKISSFGTSDSVSETADEIMELLVDEEGGSDYSTGVDAVFEELALELTE